MINGMSLKQQQYIYAIVIRNSQNHRFHVYLKMNNFVLTLFPVFTIIEQEWVTLMIERAAHDLS